jgi:tetratricopeptide (TPR) repeat protein
MADDRLARAQALKRERRYDEAVILLERLLVDEPRNGLALAHLAHCQLLRGRPGRALAELERAASVSGTTSFVARLRGEALYRLSRHREAAQAFEDAVALGDEGTWSLVWLARALDRVGDVEGARQAASRAAEREPESGQGWLMLGEIALRQGEVDQAEALLAKAHEREPENQYLYARLIEARLLQVPVDRRAAEVEVLLKSSGRGNRHLLQVLARVKSQLGDDGAAAQVWRRSQDARPDPYARKMEGYALKKAGDLEGAARVLREYLLENPGDVVAFRTYVRLQWQREAKEELEQTLQELLPVAGERRGAVYGELRKLARE